MCRDRTIASSPATSIAPPATGEGTGAAGSTGCRVLLVPGIWMPGFSMCWLARRLAAAGLMPSVFTYAGVLGGPAVCLPRLCAALAQADAVVAHSLGGLMTIEALRRRPALPPQRVLCLGSPLAGSRVAARLRTALPWLVGRSGALLQTGCAWPWPGRAQVGMIAGSRAQGVGRLLGCGKPGDGTVALEETRWPGLIDHLVLDAGHSGLLFSPAVAAAAIRFLRHGRFSPPSGGQVRGDSCPA